MAGSIISELRKFVAPEFIFGVGARSLAANYIKKYDGKRIMLITDNVVANAGWSTDIRTQLEMENFEVIQFDNVTPNPKDFEVMAGADLYLEKGCDVMLAVGGGSVIDCAKGIGIVVTNGGHIINYEGVDMVPVPMPPLICIPTTGGTSADVSQFAIINHTDERYKFAIISKSVVPDIALVDPETLMTMSPYLTACTGIDALVHAIEAFVSNANSPITDIHAMEAIKLIYNNLLNSVKEPENIEFRKSVMLASLQAGLAFSNASLGAVHAMAHSLGGYLDLPHGECNALLLQHVIDFNYNYSPERYHKIAGLIDCDTRGLNSNDTRKSIIKKIHEFRNQCGITEGLSQRGVKTADISLLSEKAINDPCNATNPRPPTEDDLKAIYREAL